MRKHLSIFASLLLSASAQDPPRPPQQSYVRVHHVLSRLDTNSDGILSADEIANCRKSLLLLDIDGDGLLSVDELKLPVPGDIGIDELVQSLLANDKNGDGILTKKELPERMQGLILRGDLNHNGSLDRAELRKLVIAMKFPDGRPDPTRPPRIDLIVAVFDLDGNGALSAAELDAAPTSLRTLDKDGDGQIVDAEVRPVRKPPANPEK